MVVSRYFDVVNLRFHFRGFIAWEFQNVSYQRLQNRFRDFLAMAVPLALILICTAVPSNRSVAGNPLICLTAEGAPYFRCKLATLGLGAIPTPFSMLTDNLLRGLKGRFVDDRRVRFRRVVLGKLSFIGHLTLAQMVTNEGFLQQRVPCVFFIRENVTDMGAAEGLTQRAGLALRVEPPAYGAIGFSGNRPMKNITDDFSTVRVNFSLSVFNSISQHEPPAHHLALFKALANAPFLIFADRKTLFLRKGRQKSERLVACPS